MSFVDDNTAYEAWLAMQCDVVIEDIKAKHRLMKHSAFMFLRATYFRWARQLPQICPELMNAPRVLCVGDLHLENFGTWRDADGRLVWGVNDFDEATRLPWTQDLVRLAAGVHLAVGGDIIGLGRRAAADAILEGYRAGMEAGGPAFVLEEQH